MHSRSSEVGVCRGPGVTMLCLRCRREGLTNMEQCCFEPTSCSTWRLMLGHAPPQTSWRRVQKGWLHMSEWNDPKNLVYIRGVHQVNYKMKQIAPPLFSLSFAFFVLLIQICGYDLSMFNKCQDNVLIYIVELLCCSTCSQQLDLMILNESPPTQDILF